MGSIAIININVVMKNGNGVHVNNNEYIHIFHCACDRISASQSVPSW